jgi:hypothetical protein
MKRRREARPHHKGESRFYDMGSADADDLLNVSAARLARSSPSQLHRGFTTSVSVLLNCKFSAVGQSRRFVSPLTASGPPPTADTRHRDHYCRKVPEPEVACVWIALYAAFLFFVFRRTYSCQTMSRQNPKLFHPTFS